MLSFLRGSTPPRRNTASQNPIYYEDGKSWQRFNHDSEWLVSHFIPNNTSMFNPPTHLHLYQTEDFRVLEGTGIWHQPTRSDSARRVVKEAGDEPIHLPAGTFHRFENASETDPLVVDFKINSDFKGPVEERFFRNFFGYLDDCRVQGTAPSLFQLQLFLYTMDGPLAIPVPGPDWLKWWVSRSFMLVTGICIGEWLLGYKRTYEEYFSEKSR